MKTKFTLIFLIFILFTFPLKAQTDPIPSLIITEAHTINAFVCRSYVELTNVGTEPLNLSQFKLAANSWTSSLAFQAKLPFATFLPDVVLQPGQSYLVANVRDLAEKLPELGLARTWPFIWDIVDLPVHVDEHTVGTDGGLDSISAYYGLLPTGGGWAIYLEYHNGLGDSVVVDGVYLDVDPVANRISGNVEKRAVAGYPEGWGQGNVIVRKTTVTKGNVNWEDSRGTNPEDSEWIVIPARGLLGDFDARFYTTIKHHGNTELNASSVSSSTITIDWANKKMSVPWGIYKDFIMDEFELGPGIGFQYTMSPSFEDSTHRIVVSGDSLTLIAVGASAQIINFTLEQLSPAADMNLLFEMNRQTIVSGEATGWHIPFYVTEGEPVIDTVGAIPFRTRVDTLFKYLDKAENATWEIIWIDGANRIDVKRGDILKVTAQNGSIKNYFLAVDSIPMPSHNANLGAITWPDAPFYVRLDPRWNDDTIPRFNPNLERYMLELPYGTVNVPALKAIPANLNARVTEKRAIRLNGTVADRTTTFSVTAEDDSTVKVYSVVFSVETLPEYVQEFTPDPIISEIVRKAWRQNNYIEITNPGNQALDLSKYMIIRGWPGEDPTAFFARQNNSWKNRYVAFIPGYDYQSEAEWDVQKAIIQKDLSVNPILGPGESFVIAFIESGSGGWRYNHQCDVIFTPQASLFNDPIAGNAPNAKIYWHNANTNYTNAQVVPFIANPAGDFTLNIYKILNDSIRNGTKGIGDLNDFELTEMFGMYDGSKWAPCGWAADSHNNWFRRKPNYWEGQPLPGLLGSWGENAEESEWIHKDWNIIALERNLTNNYAAEQFMAEDIGQHAMDDITVFMSTIESYVYKVSEGYLTPQNIEGVESNTKVSYFLSLINKNDPGQVLEVLGKGNDDLVTNNDTLMVTSADGASVTKYYIVLGALSSNAVLTSSKYTINIDGAQGTISGIPAGTTVKEVRNSVTKHQSASLNIIDANNHLVPIQIRNFDSVYVETKATNRLFFEVIAENGVTKITYQLQLDLSNSEAFVFSDLFLVDQVTRKIAFVPDGIRVGEFAKNITPNAGAVMKLLDKTGSEVLQGNVAYDDIVVVTSPDGTTSKVYVLDFIFEPKGIYAYVVSNMFDVNQLNKVISGILPDLNVQMFYSMVTAAPGSTMTILDSNGNEKTSGQVTNSDKLRVVSGDGQLTVNYTLTTTVDVGSPTGLSEIRVYPNPSRDMVYVEGISGNSIIEVRNILGATVKMIQTDNTDKVNIQMNELSSGIYFIVIKTRNNSQFETVKVMKQ